ncbi:GntR family transcriptional regulator [Piscinibacter sp.]|jgi:DNA-binding GntR family transcriptional regulator|uniref:GntR family transcriptional regulator n=1 Tax=Piscinibacter sp. TaxID=1903157 RepID=UPI002F40FFFC
MARKIQKRPKLIEVNSASAAASEQAAPRGRSPMNLFELAYEGIEDRLVNCQLKPGRFLAMQDLQALVSFGRTPVHQAVNRLAADTLLIVHPRRGLQIAPIDLARERVLLRLRRDVERFVIRLAAEQSSSSHRNQMLHLKRQLRENREQIDIEKFNLIDRRLDRLFMAAAGEPFVENTLRPLHTIFRRLGWIYHTQVAAGASLLKTIDAHLTLLDAVANRHVDAAIAASDELIDFVDSMFDVLEREIDPALLDCSLDSLDGA